jgi:hypothetical protein
MQKCHHFCSMYDEIRWTKGKERNSDGWITLLHAGHDLGLMCFPFFYRIFLPQYKYCMLLVGNQVLWKLQCKFLHFKSTRADVHYASASWFKPGTLGFQVGNATNWAIEVGKTKLNKIVILPYFLYNLKMKSRINLTTLFLTKSYLLNTIKPFSGHENRSLTKSQKPLQGGYP